MRSFKKLACAAVLATAGTLASTSANAAIAVNDWQIDFTTVGGVLVTGIDAMGFNDAPVWARTSDGGATYTITGLGSIGTLLSDQTGLLNSGCSLGLPGGCELTFTFELQVAVTGAVPGGGFTFTHIAGSDVLNFYLDDSANANPGNGTGYDDGTLIATFDVLAGEGGQVSLLTLDGSDDAIFQLSQLNDSTIFLDSEGNPLLVGTTLAMTDSNFDLDPDGNDAIDTTRANFDCGTDLTSFCVLEDGTVRLAQQVPEPGTLLLLGSALAGFAGLRRVRKA